MLLRRQPHHQTIEFGREHDLAAQAAVGLGWAGSEVQHVALVGHRGRQLVDPGRVDHDVAGGAGQGAAAVGFDAAHVGVHGGFHEALAGFGLDVLHRLVGGDESDVDHGGEKVQMRLKYSRRSKSALSSAWACRSISLRLMRQK